MASKAARKGKMQVYNAADSHEEKEALDEKPGFKHGGKTKKKHEMKDGGHAHGEKARHRSDRRPRMAAGGKAGGGSPYSSGRRISHEGDSGPGMGHEGARPSAEDD